MGVPSSGCGGGGVREEDFLIDVVEVIITFLVSDSVIIRKL